MVFRRKRTMRASASRLLLPFVSAEFGNKQLCHTFLCNSQNYHTLGAVDDPMHCCPRPSTSCNSATGPSTSPRGDSLTVAQKAEGNSASGHPQHRKCDSFDCCTERYEPVVTCILFMSLYVLAFYLLRIIWK